MTTTADLRAEVDAKGQEISRAARKIENQFENTLDWKKIVHEKPLESFGVAVGLGLLVSGGAAPLIRTIGSEIGVLAKGSLTAYVMSVIASKNTQ